MSNLAGQAWLRERFELSVPEPAVISYVGPGTRRTVEREGRQEDHYPIHYSPDDTVSAHLRFALRYEPADFRILAGTFAQMDGDEIAQWVRASPTSIYARRAWFLFETFTGRKLDLPETTSGGYVPALDSKLHITVESGVRSPRHRVLDNLLGNRHMCVTVRRTKRLEDLQARRPDQAARQLLEQSGPELLARAVSYLFTKETRSSFEIEGEVPSSGRSERFVAALRGAASFPTTDKNALLRLQSEIIDPRYALEDWRTFQNFVGETVGGYRQHVHYVCPPPEAVPMLMVGWTTLASRLLTLTIDPVVAAAAISFAFVFVHPFDDGNGRVHRFLINNILARLSYTPPGIVFPVSASIVRNLKDYDSALETFSQPVMNSIRWHLSTDEKVVVDSCDLNVYRYWDATALAEYLYERVDDAVHSDLKNELDFLARYDRAIAAAREIVDMPDRRASLFVRFVLQNDGKLARRKRADFPELSDDDVSQLEKAISRAAASE